MSIYKGTQLLSGVSVKTKVNTHNLFDHKWCDYTLSDQSWLNADTFSWQDGTVYTQAYNHLVNDIQGKSASTEIIDGTTVTYYLADDGHKIVDVANVSAIETVYSSTGVAWYYVLDTTNQRFKLPRTKFGFTGVRDAVGNYVEAGLPNITGTFRAVDTAGLGLNASGAIYLASSYDNGSYAGGGGRPNSRADLGLDASLSSSIYGSSTTVQPPTTQMYLYFYIGDFSQSATEQTAGLNSSLFNNKIDLDGNNATFVHIVETYSNGTDWYKIYSNGWCEQGGTATVNANSQYNGSFLVEFKDTNICFYATDNDTALSVNYWGTQQGCGYSSKSQFYLRTANDGSTKFSWNACGFVN